MTLIATAFAAVLVVVIELPTAMLKASPPAPLVLAWMATTAGPALIAPFSDTALAELSTAPPLSVVPADWVSVPPVVLPPVLVLTVTMPPAPC